MHNGYLKYEDQKSHPIVEIGRKRPTNFRQYLLSQNSTYVITIGLPRMFVQSFYVQSKVPDSSILLGYDNGIQKNGILLLV